MINIKNLYFVFIITALTQHFSAVAIPDFFWIGYASKKIWSCLPSFNFNYFTKRNAELLIGDFKQKMNERYNNLEFEISKNNESSQANLKKKYTKIKVENNKYSKELEEELSEQSKKVDELMDGVTKNGQVIKGLDEEMHSFKEANQKIKNDAGELYENTQKTNILFEKSEDEVGILKKNYNELRSNYGVLATAHEVLKKQWGTVYDQNKKMEGIIKTLINDLHEKEKSIDYLSKFIEKHLHPKNDSFRLISENFNTKNRGQGFIPIDIASD